MMNPYNMQWQQQGYMQACQFDTQDNLQQVFMLEVCRSPETEARQALQAEDLMNVMNNTHSISDYYGINWSREMCSIMIAMLDYSGDGFMQWPEFLELQTCLNCWFNVFMQYATLGLFVEACELVNIMVILFGNQLQQSKITTLLECYTQYSNTEKTQLAFDDFVSVCVWLRAYTGIALLLIDESWWAVSEPQFQESYFKVLDNKLKRAYQQGETIFPPKDLIFNALNLTPLDEVKVVIVGQDPYHGDHQAMGLAFSVPIGEKLPSSLQNICKELIRDPEISVWEIPDHGSLEKWAKDGVLLLNATLTVA